MNNVSEAFTAHCQASGTAQISISKHGHLCFELQLTNDPVDVYAVQKGILAVLIGIAENRFFLERYDAMNHILEPEWTQLEKPDEASLSVETLLDMTTGMDDHLCLNGRIGHDWRYNNVAFQFLKQALEIQTGEKLNELTRAWLLEPLGIEDTYWQDRSPDTEGRVFSALYSTASSLRVIGEALLNDALIDTEFKQTLSTPSASTNPAWHLGWWNNAADSYQIPGKNELFKGPLLPDAPPDLISARGAGGHHLSISAQKGWVIAQTMDPSRRQSDTRQGQSAFWQLIDKL